MRNETIIVTRGHIGQWASIIGGVALLMGIIGLIWQGGLTSLVILALAIGAIAGLALAMRTVRAPVSAAMAEGRRLIDSIGWAAVLPQVRSVARTEIDRVENDEKRQRVVAAAEQVVLRGVGERSEVARERLRV